MIITWEPAVVCPVCLLNAALPRPEAVVENRDQWVDHLFRAHSTSELIAYSAFVADAQQGTLPTSESVSATDQRPRAGSPDD